MQYLCRGVVFPRVAATQRVTAQQYSSASEPQPFVPLRRSILNPSHFRSTFMTFIALCFLFNCSSVEVFIML